MGPFSDNSNLKNFIMDQGRYLRSRDVSFHCFLFSGSFLPSGCLASLHYLLFSVFPEHFLHLASLCILHQSHSAPPTIIKIQMSPSLVSVSNSSSTCQLDVSRIFQSLRIANCTCPKYILSLFKCQVSSQSLSSRGWPSTSPAVNCLP